MSDPSLTIGVTTRNRPASLARCLASLERLADDTAEIIVVDDGSEAPLGPALSRLPPPILHRLSVLQQTGGEGYIVARNTIVRRAATPYVLLLDDDTSILDAGPLREALRIFDREPGVAAIACAQAELDGSPWPAAMQPSPAGYPCLVPAFIGFAHLLRRSTFLALGGYRESLHFYGEEKEYCLRVLEAGGHIVYLPEARVAHAPDPAGRSHSRYLRYVIRNDCLSALYNEPLLLALASVSVRLRRYRSMRRQAGVDDPGGLRWIVGELLAALPRIRRERRPIRWHTVRRWRALRRLPPAFHPARLERGTSAS